MQPPNSNTVLIRQVWAFNLDQEFQLVRALIRNFPFISMDTEFPGVIHSPKIDPTIPYHLRKIDPIDQYCFMKKNVDDLKLIQLGLTLSDADGNLPSFGGKSYIWEFNFSDFNITCDLYNKDSIELLQRQGIDFYQNYLHGVASSDFAKLMLKSELVNNPFVTWVTFHSAYDFGYLVKILTGKNLPYTLDEFLYNLRALFGQNVYDMKYMIMKNQPYCKTLFGGLERVANTLKVSRAVGNSHQAGSDSLLTWHAFKKMLEVYFRNNNVSEHAGVLFGLENVAY